MVQARVAVVLGEVGIPLRGGQLHLDAFAGLQVLFGRKRQLDRTVPSVDVSNLLRPRVLHAHEKDEAHQQGPAILTKRFHQRWRRELSVQWGQRVHRAARRALLHHQRRQ